MDDEYPVAADDHTDYSRSPGYRPKHGSGGHRRLWFIVAIIAVLVLGAGAYWLLSRHKLNAPAQQATNSSASHPNLPRPQANATNKTFKSTKLNIEVTYRSDWTLKEAADKDELVLTSPAVTYADKSGVSKEGVFTLKLRNGVIPDPMQATVQQATAVKDSEVIAYTQPTEAQRHYTNLSYGGPDAAHATFVIVSGSTAYKTGQAFGTLIDLHGTSYLFAGGYGTDASDSLAFDQVPLSAFFETAIYKQAIDVISSLKIY